MMESVKLPNSGIWSKRTMPTQEKSSRMRKKRTRKEKMSEIMRETVRMRGPTRRLRPKRRMTLSHRLPTRRARR